VILCKCAVSVRTLCPQHFGAHIPVGSVMCRCLPEAWRYNSKSVVIPPGDLANVSHTPVLRTLCAAIVSAFAHPSGRVRILAPIRLEGLKNLKVHPSNNYPFYYISTPGRSLKFNAVPCGASLVFSELQEHAHFEDRIENRLKPNKIRMGCLCGVGSRSR
jgi:hypothetical protein